MAFSKMLNVLAILFAITYVRDATTKCKPKTMVRQADGCNFCMCTPRGELGACTLRDCRDGHRHKRNFPILARETGCVKGRRLTSIDDCNTCYCGNDGVFNCEVKPTCSEDKKLIDDDGSCKPGLKISTTNGCKQCICNEDGYMICHLNQEKCRICYPGKHFIPDGDCNVCNCSSDGMSALACTNEKCAQVRSVKDEPCGANENFTSVDGITFCTCIVNQGIAMCNKEH